MNFKSFNLKDEIIEVLNSISFTKPTLTQINVLPKVLKGENVCVKAPTGSGKTHCFLIPIFNKIDPNLNYVQAIILSPTRELAKQIYEMAKPFANKLNIKTMLLSSGSDRLKDQKSIESSIPQLIIGTPGRIKDIAFDNAIFNITNAKTVVMDEADMILEEGFLDEVGLILSKLKDNINFLAFSASLPNNLIHFLDKYITDLKYLDLSKNTITSENVTHVAYPTRNKDRLTVLEHLMNAINPYICIIFASKKDTVNSIYEYLLNKNYKVGLIHGDLSNTERKTTMKRINSGYYQFIVASDIAARGIDINGVSEVINFDLPYEEEFYFHRAGRTGRNNTSGTCFTLYDKDEINKLESLHKKGINFINQEYRDSNWVELKDLFKKPNKSNKKNPLDKQIREVVNKNKNKKVKPNYKKKQKQEIDKIKRKHKREIIENDIKRQRLERYKENSRNKRLGGE